MLIMPLSHNTKLLRVRRIIAKSATTIVTMAPAPTGHRHRVIPTADGGHSRCKWGQEVGEIVDDLGGVPLHDPRLAQRHDVCLCRVAIQEFKLSYSDKESSFFSICPCFMVI